MAARKKSLKAVKAAAIAALTVATPAVVVDAEHATKPRAMLASGLPPVSVAQTPAGVVATIRGPRPTLEDLFPGPNNLGLRESIRDTGLWRRGGKHKDVRVMLRPTATGQQEVMLMEGVQVAKDKMRAAASVSRNPGTTLELLDSFDDFQFTGGRDKASEVQQMWTIYDHDGLVNTSVNKIAALMSSGGQFKVRTARKGKKQKAREELQAILDEVNLNVNNAPLDGVVTGARGLKMVTQQAVRQCLVEGDWFGRMVWVEHEVRTLGRFSLPMIIQSISTANMEPITEIISTGIEAWYWKPDTALIGQLTTPKDAVVRDLLKRYVDSKTLTELKKNRKVYLDQSLLIHVKHRGIGNSAFGESFIAPALYAVAYKRAVEQLDLVVVNSLINRLTIVMVGSSDPKSPYSDPAVAQQRQQSMQAFFDDPGPNMTIIWQGDDVKVVDIGAHSTVLDLDGRHQVGERMKKEALGVPDSLITGSSTDGKASGMASLLSAGASLDEIQSSFEQVHSTMGQRVAEENGFVDTEILYEYDNAMIDRAEERNQARLDYVAGGMSLRSWISARGQDPDAEFRQACFEKGLEPSTTLWKDAFAPPQGLPGQGKGGPPGQEGNPGGGGRTPDGVTGKPPVAPKETKSPVPNK